MSSPASSLKALERQSIAGKGKRAAHAAATRAATTSGASPASHSKHRTATSGCQNWRRRTPAEPIPCQRRPPPPSTPVFLFLLPRARFEDRHALVPGKRASWPDVESRGGGGARHGRPRCASGASLAQSADTFVCGGAAVCRLDSLRGLCACVSLSTSFAFASGSLRRSRSSRACARALSRTSRALFLACSRARSLSLSRARALALPPSLSFPLALPPARSLARSLCTLVCV